MINKSEWIDWKANPVTKAFYEACIVRISEAKDELAVTAGLDSDADNMLRGFIRAYVEMLDFTVEDVVEDEE